MLNRWLYWFPSLGDGRSDAELVEVPQDEIGSAKAAAESAVRREMYRRDLSFPVEVSVCHISALDLIFVVKVDVKFEPAFISEILATPDR